MSGDESFLARWSRRKRAAAQPTREPQAGEKAGVPPPAEAASPAPTDELRPTLDPAALPPIESIGPGSDIQAFLAPGVPAALMRAALRRAWAAEPAIRDFIGLSENAWDFTVPDGVPGAGSVTAEDVRRLLSQAMGAPDAAAMERPPVESSAGDTAAPASDARQAAQPSGQNQPERDDSMLLHDADPSVRSVAADAALQQDLPQRKRPPEVPRGHGRALPK